MGKGGGSLGTGISPTVSTDITNDVNALTALSTQEAGNAEQLYNLAEPGLVQSQNFYEQLASGDPGAIMRAISPTAQAANQAATGARSNILANAPAGGEKNLALENVDVQRAGEIAKTASGASVGANNALAKLGTSGVGLSNSMTGTAIGAESAGLSGLSSLGGLQIQGQQMAMEQKGQSMWPIQQGMFIAGDVGASGMKGGSAAGSAPNMSSDQALSAYEGLGSGGGGGLGSGGGAGADYSDIGPLFM
jgi:hypothetical protein